jgi:hypothetical protein
LTYGFKCDCPSCKALEAFGELTPPANIASIQASLREFLAFHPTCEGFWNVQNELPSFLRGVLTEPYIQQMAEEFSSGSHEASYDKATRAGSHLLEIYRLIYPKAYPQIGLCYLVFLLVCPDRA